MCFPKDNTNVVLLISLMWTLHVITQMKQMRFVNHRGLIHIWLTVFTRMAEHQRKVQRHLVPRNAFNLVSEEDTRQAVTSTQPSAAEIQTWINTNSVLPSQRQICLKSHIKNILFRILNFVVALCLLPLARNIAVFFNDALNANNMRSTCVVWHIYTYTELEGS